MAETGTDQKASEICLKIILSDCLISLCVLSVIKDTHVINLNGR